MGGDNWVSKSCAAYGGVVGGSPAPLACLPFLTTIIFFIVGILLEMPWVDSDKNGIMTTKELEQDWCQSGGKLARDVDQYFAMKNPDWKEDGMAHLSVYSLKGEKAGEDFVSAKTLEFILDDLKKFKSMTVDVAKPGGGKVTYTTLDLCNRGIIPDNPNSSMQLHMPCFQISPLTCFSEYAELLPETYAAVVEPNINTSDPNNMLAPFGYRPSFRTSTPEQLRNILSEGCLGNNFMLKAPPKLFAGATEYGAPRSAVSGFPGDGSEVATIESLGALRNMIMMEPAGAISLRMNFADPEKADIDLVHEAILLHSAKYSKYLYDKDKAQQTYDVSNLAVEYVKQFKLDMEKTPWLQFIASGMLSVGWAVWAAKSFKFPYESRGTMALLGMNLVSLALIWAMSLSIMCGRYLSGIAMGACPLVQLGLGADDMFVLIHAFNLLGEDFIRENDNKTVISTMFNSAGPGVLLTSICNGLAFLCGVFIPLKGMSDMCFLLLLCVIANLFFLCTAFLALFCWEANRIRANKPDMMLAPLHAKRIASGNASKTYEDIDFQDKLHDCFEKKLLAFCNLPACKFGNPLFAVLLLVLNILSILFMLEPGWDPTDFAPESNPTKKAFAMTFGMFQTFPAYWFHWNVDIVKYRLEILQTYDDLSNSQKTKFTTPFLAPPWISLTPLFFYFFQGLPANMFNHGPDGGIARLKGSTLAGDDWTTTMGDLGCLPDGPPFGPGDVSAPYAPYGVIPADHDTFWMCYHLIADIPTNNVTGEVDPQKALSLGMMMGGNPPYNTFHAFGHNWYGFKEEWPRAAYWSYFVIFTNDTVTDSQILEVIELTDAILEASPFNDTSFLYSPLTVFWRAFIGLDVFLWILVGISLGIIGVVCAVLLTSPKAAFIGVLISAMIVIDVWGILCAMTPFLKFNPFIVSIVVSAGGLSVEFISHTLCSFMNGHGSGRRRLKGAMTETFVPLINGSVSTCLSLVPMIFNEITFLPKYYFLSMNLIVSIGFLHGFVILPSMLLAMGDMTGLRKSIDSFPAGQEPDSPQAAAGEPEKPAAEPETAKEPETKTTVV